MRGLRASAPAAACAERSSAIVRRLIDLPVLTKAKRVALFWPMEARHEVDLRPLDQALRGRGVRVAYPAVDPEATRMTFRFIDDVGEMREAGNGFQEPPPESEEAKDGDLDAIVVPALCVDPRGHRIGYGAGYYDRTLPRYAPPAVAIAVAYEYQLVPEVPNAEDDVTVSWVITDARTLAVP